MFPNNLLQSSALVQLLFWTFFSWKWPLQFLLPLFPLCTLYSIPPVTLDPPAVPHRPPVLQPQITWSKSLYPPSPRIIIRKVFFSGMVVQLSCPTEWKGTVYNGKGRQKSTFFSSSFGFPIRGDGFSGENWWGWHVWGLLPSPGALSGCALRLTAASWIGVFPFLRSVLQLRKKEALSTELMILNCSVWLGLAGPIQSGTAFELSVAKATVVIRFSGTTGDPL